MNTTLALEYWREKEEKGGGCGRWVDCDGGWEGKARDGVFKCINEKN